jgi:Carbohydrate esterase, sialic acid-specific acetylesterase
MNSHPHLWLVKPLFLAAVLAIFAPASSAQTASKPLKVFILAGQSNMDGHAKISTFDHIGMDPKTAPILRKMRADDGTPRVCDEVWISYFQGPEEGGEGFGPLTAGYGSRRNPLEDGGKIGPEFSFGIYMHELLNEPILIIKTAWGGKNLHTDFRSPSAGPYVFNEHQLEGLKKQGKEINKAKADAAAATGRYYRLMIEHVQRVLKDINRVCPTYDPQQGYQLAGFVWFQGWNDMVDGGTYPRRSEPGGYALYSELLAHFIRDVRKDLAAPEMPFVIGVLGVGGPVDQYSGGELRYKSTHDGFRKAMAAPAEMPEFRANVAAVLTEKYWDPELDEVAEKSNKLAQMARKLKDENKGYPAEQGTISPEAQQQILQKYRAETFTARDLELLKGISNAAYHYRGSAKIMAQIGKAFAEATVALIGARKEK